MTNKGSDRTEFDNYTDYTSKTAFYPHSHTGDFFELNYIVLGLGGEAGEVVDCWKKICRGLTPDDLTQLDEIKESDSWDEHAPKLLDELGDTVWYLSHMIRALGISLEDLMLLNMYKLYCRHADWMEWPFEMTEQQVIDQVNAVYTKVVPTIRESLDEEKL